MVWVLGLCRFDEHLILVVFTTAPGLLNDFRVFRAGWRVTQCDSLHRNNLMLPRDPLLLLLLRWYPPGCRRGAIRPKFPKQREPR